MECLFNIKSIYNARTDISEIILLNQESTIVRKEVCECVCMSVDSVLNRLLHVEVENLVRRYTSMYVVLQLEVRFWILWLNVFI